MFENPVQRLSEEEQEEMRLRYYDSDVHKGSFTLPRFARKVDTLMVATTPGITGISNIEYVDLTPLSMVIASQG